MEQNGLAQISPSKSDRLGPWLKQIGPAQLGPCLQTKPSPTATSSLALGSQKNVFNTKYLKEQTQN